MFDSSKLAGIFPAMFTPMKTPDRFDEQGLRRLVRYLTDGGVHGLFVLGSGGEFPVFTPEERGDIIGIVVDEVDGKVPIIVGTSAETTRKTMQNTNIAAERGASVAVILPPYYFTSTQAEVINHYQTILAETDIPILIYNNPFSTKVKISLETLHTLATKKKVVAVKDTTCDFAYHQDLLRSFEGKSVKIFQGDERLAAVSFLAGCDGGTLGLASITPRLFVELFQQAKQGNVAKVFEIQSQVNSLLRMFDVADGGDGSFFAGGKAALHLLGICENVISRPFEPLNSEAIQHVKQILNEHKLL